MMGVTHAHLGPVWYHSEPSPNQFLGWDFFCRFFQQDGSRSSNFVNNLVMPVSKYKLGMYIFYNENNENIFL